jgi:hypothetical protein
MGVEPTTSSLGSWHSTAELRPLACNSKKPFPHCQTAAGPQTKIVARPRCAKVWAL